MPPITLRYQQVGPTDAMLTRAGGVAASRNAVYGGAVADINLNTDTGGAIATIDQYMESCGFRQNSAATPPALIGEVNAFSRQQFTTPFALTYGANIATNAQLSNNFTVTLTGASAVLDNPTNVVAGMAFTFFVTQDGTGGRALTFGSNFSFGAVGTPLISTSLLNVTDVISCYALSPTKILCSVMRGFA